MIKRFKPTTNGLRHKISLLQKFQTFNKKKLTYSITKTGGRNHTGRISTRHIGGGHKKRATIIDYLGTSATYAVSKLIGVGYDSNRSSFVGIYQSPNNKVFLRLLPSGKNLNTSIPGKYIKEPQGPGTITMLKNLPVGEKIFNIQWSSKNTTQLVKAAGTFATIIKQNKKETLIKMPSKALKSIPNHNFCTIGVSSNINHNKKILGKAGANRWIGIRPTVRGEAMNAIDHPHGGKTSGGVRLKTIYGKLAKFVKTR